MSRSDPDLSRHTALPFWLTVAALFFGFLSPELLSDGMFSDGVIYAAIAKNMAHGLGSFWTPFFSETLMTRFHEHPPLALGLQAVWFKVLGDGRFVERLYSLCTLILTLWLFVRLWLLGGGKRITGWLPFFFLATIQLVYWSYGNNMLENTLGLFTILAVYLTWRGLEGRSSALWLSGAGLCVFAGLLVKGPPALFPLVVPVVYGVVYRNRRGYRVAADSLILFVACALPLVLLVALSTDARVSLGTYFNAQIIHSFENVQTVGSRFAILQRLFKELLPLMLLSALILGLGKLKGIAFTRLRATLRPAMFFLLVGVAASFPFLVSLKQSGFYLVPSFPFYALAFASLVAPVVGAFQARLDPDRNGFKTYRVVSIALVVAALAVAAAQVNRIGRDREKLLAAYAVIDLVPPQTTVDVCPTMGADWTLHGYCARYGPVSLDRDEQTKRRFLFSDRSCRPDEPGNARELELPTQDYLLFERLEEVTTPP